MTGWKQGGSYPCLLCFFSGVTIACFCEAGSRPAASDELIILVMSGSRMSMNSRTRNVGMGSRDDDLTGDDIMIRHTSLSVHGRMHASEDDAGTNIGGGGRPAVSDQTAAILRAKNVAKPSAMCSVAHDVCRSRPSSDNNERHSDDGERPQPSSRWCQYASFFSTVKVKPATSCIDPLLGVGGTAWLPIPALEPTTVSARRPTFGVEPRR